MTDIDYSHTWRAGPNSKLHVVELVGGPPAVYDVACGARRGLADEDGEHYDYRFRDWKMCQRTECQAGFAEMLAADPVPYRPNECG